MPARADQLSAAPVVGLALLIAICAGLLMAFWQSTASLIDVWASDGFRHGYLVPLVSVYLLWEVRSRLSLEQWRGNWWGVAAVALLLWVHHAAVTVGAQLVAHMVLPLLLIAAAVAVLGTASRHVLFPLGFLILAVPFGIGWVPDLMEITATISTGFIRAIGYPIYREGMYLLLPGGMFEVAEACSGFRYLTAGVTAAALIAYTAGFRWWQGAVFLIGASLFFVLLNSVRAIVVMLVASETDMRYLAHDHVTFGWVLFAIGMVFIVWTSARLERRWVPQGQAVG